MERVASTALDGESLVTPELIEVDPLRWGRRDADRAGQDPEAATGMLALTLDLAAQGLENGRPASDVIARLAETTHQLRRQCAPEHWERLMARARSHRVMDALLQDPFTRWSFEKPRGYSGDAHLLDFIYGHEAVAAEIADATPLGRAVHAHTTNASSSVAVRERRDILAGLVDEGAERTGDVEVLAVAAGHLREASLSRAHAEGRVGRWVALDQDPLSVGTMLRDHAGSAIESIDGSVRGLLRRAYKLGSFDVVYAAGLYDYLPAPVAVRLTQRCMELVRPGGTFLFANFSDETRVDGYMEAFMNWALLLRGEREMWGIVNGAVDRNTVDAKVWFGANRDIVYATLRKHDDATHEGTLPKQHTR